jgi:hypothetical protein
MAELLYLGNWVTIFIKLKWRRIVKGLPILARRNSLLWIDLLSKVKTFWEREKREEDRFIMSIALIHLLVEGIAKIPTFRSTIITMIPAFQVT